MKRIKRSVSLSLSLFVLTFPILSTGCVSTPPPIQEPAAEERFEVAVNRLIEGVLNKQRHTPGEMAPAAVMPASLKAGSTYSRLEEYILERLAIRLRQQHDIYSFSRQNWFEYREGRPLSFGSLPASDRSLMQNLIIYEVGVNPDEVMKKAKAHILATDVSGRSISGVVSEAEFDFEKDAPANRLHVSAPRKNPFPLGLEERPYASIDRMSYSLAAELADAYRTGLKAGDQRVADAEVRVLLYTQPSGGISRGILHTIQNGLQQAVIGQRGFTCAVSTEDLGTAFQKIDFYRKNKSFFELEESSFTAGTVLLMADIFRHPDGKKIGAALRAVWRVSPLEADTGDFIPTNVAGTYLSGFTAKAYLDRSAIKTGYETSVPASGPASIGSVPSLETEQPIAPVPEATEAKLAPELYEPVTDLGICFFRFTEVYEKRLYPILSEAPGIASIRRADELCAQEGSCLCYELEYQGGQEKLSAYLNKNLRTSNTVPFKIKSKGENRLELHFHGGFE
ncbi:MAG: hypothetical protein C4530_24115 [Desulfobacteraceae bacterium]|nr:MAG: hypothetical protein C4530_24115 [Desulfobacteraceae bacterium]